MLRVVLTLLLCLFSVCSWAANGDITACRIKGTEPGDGWVLQIDVESSGGSAIQTGGTYAAMTSGNNVPTSAAPALTVTSLGFDSAGSPTTVTRTIYGTYRLRKPYYGNATQTLTSDETNVSGGDQVVVGSKTYIFQDSLTGCAANDVAIGADAATSLTNLYKAINLNGTAGTNYCAGTTANAQCRALNPTATTLIAESLTDGNDTYTTTTTAAHLSWGGTTTTGGTTYVELANETLAAGTLTLEIVLSDFIYAKDEAGAGNSGTDITISIEAGLYTDGTTATGAFTGMVTNNSTLVYPQPVTNWDIVGHDLVTSVIPLSMVGMSNHPLNNQPLAAVTFSCTDGTHTVSSTVTGNGMTRTTDGNAIEYYHYAASLSTATLDDNTLATCNYQAYPHIGDSDAVFDTNGAVPAARAETSWLPRPIKFLVDQDSDYGQSFAFVAPGNDACTAEGVPNACCTGAGTGTCTGSDTTGAVSTDLNTARATPFATIAKAAKSLGAYNNANLGRNNGSNSIGYLEEGRYQGGGSNNTYTNVDPTCWMTITAAPGAAKENVIVATNGTAYVVSGTYVKVSGITLFKDANKYILPGTATTSVWLFDDCVISGDITRTVMDWSGGLAFQRRCTVNASSTHPGYGNVNIGNTFTDCKGVSYPYLVIGNIYTSNVNAVLFTESSSSAAKADGTIIYANKFLGLQAGGTLAQWSWSLGSLIANNLFEMANDVADGGLLMLAGTYGPGTFSSDVDSIIMVNNTFVGSREIMGYDSGVTISNRRQWLVAGNSFDYYAQKGDIFMANSRNVGHWPLLFGVNHYGNTVRGGAFEQEFGGLYYKSGVVGDYLDQKFVNDTTVKDGGDGLTVGDYRVYSNSPNTNLVINKPLFPYDLDGKRRRIEADDAGAYTRGLPKIF